MNVHLQRILDIIQEEESLSEEKKSEILKAVKETDKQLILSDFKFERSEKIKRTTSILLEETIEELEQKQRVVEEAKLGLQRSLEELKNTQDQLVQQEKLASLGQLTAGIAHEIKNPLNFVNNFAGLNIELIDEVIDELQEIKASDVKEDVMDLLHHIKNNMEKIHQHGARANGIVNSMLHQSRGSSGKLEPVDINLLIREFTNLAYHGMRASKNPINVNISYELDKSVGVIPLIAEDFSRVIVNLCSNGFDALRQKALSPVADYSEETEEFKPKLTVKTLREKNTVQIEVKDNGTGIPDDIKDKILQPFYTTKKGSEGTGLGLSITNDIIKAHGGKLNIISELGKGSTFQIFLDLKD